MQHSPAGESQPGLGHLPSRECAVPVIGQSHAEIGPSKSLCFSAVGVVWASRPFPEQVSAQANKSLTTAVQGHTKPGSVREASVRRNSGVLEGCWLHTVGLREWETRGNQTPPGSTHVSREDKLHTKVSRRQTGLRVGREKRSGGSQLREEPRGWVVAAGRLKRNIGYLREGCPFSWGSRTKARAWLRSLEESRTGRQVGPRVPEIQRGRKGGISKQKQEGYFKRGQS